MIINSLLGKFNYKLEKKFSNKNKSESYPAYLEAATKLNLDVNEYLDNNLGWIKPKPVLEETLYPFLEKFCNPVILELGPGTGRWTRFIIDKAKQMNCKEYYLVDHAVWMIDFLNTYFKNESFLRIQKNNGLRLMERDSFVDIVFTLGVFIELNPSHIYLYSKEFSRVLKPGGYCVFDYFNCESEEGWDFFINQTLKENIYFNYYPDNFIEKIFCSNGFKFERRFTYGKSNFVVFRKSL